MEGSSQPVYDRLLVLGSATPVQHFRGGERLVVAALIC